MQRRQWRKGHVPCRHIMFRRDTADSQLISDRRSGTPNIREAPPTCRYRITFSRIFSFPSGTKWLLTSVTSAHSSATARAPVRSPAGRQENALRQVTAGIMHEVDTG
ncbi:hypothetical protein AAFF_G00229690 [Aldrovandia affinis]|uniref:Uncharacterized protein n=1 Tax=Aldrovandia affinis TaxID=143900 RepID=A0AAD7SVS7_9TELE|nr:hypothetical protein AAFF_G00229690 [Aldrovandia affinis]